MNMNVSWVEFYVINGDTMRYKCHEHEHHEQSLINGNGK